ncbi:MAG: carboxypeptidase M32 [Rhodospirillaceae bacterium]|nr:carboxypeptidase M32 [Rhodospirillaceae bacterium]
MNAYLQLEERFRTIATLEDAAGMLHWDAATMMPPGSAEDRHDQLAVLTTIRHDMLSSSETGELLAAALDTDALNDWQQANLREMERRYKHATAVETSLVTALTKASNICETRWRRARADNDFGVLKPLLADVLSLSRDAAQSKAERLGCTPYEALMDQFTPGLHTDMVDALFDRLGRELPDLLSEILEHQASQPEAVAPAGPFPLDQQRALGARLMTVVGFDFETGRLDESLHPFSGGTPDDLRITTRYEADDFMTGLMGVLHETGHALYEKNLPSDWRRQPVGAARGMDIHESQSLLIEMQACRSLEFLSFASPLMEEVFERVGPEWAPDNLYRVYTKVRPGLIRVDADEVTYPLHVILRYRLEKALLADDLPLDDLPSAWNDGMAELLNQTPPDDRDGCLQDIHWFDGAFGYFPSYTFGAVIAAQLFGAATTADPVILPEIQAGNFKPLFAWLGKQIHGKGSLLETPDLIRAATGEELNADVFLGHLRKRYLAQS